ncbi:hypothetical protein Ddc_13124 [Ditylenchus destructor]|nr:hypothetical protein Ddc_13124 [Ditylenchus destructor]
MADYTNIVELISRTIGSVLYAIAFYRIFRILQHVYVIYRYQRQRGTFTVSVPLIIFFVCWMFEIITYIPNCAAISWYWQPSGECRVFACLFKNTRQAIFTTTRMVGAFINSIAGALFFYKLWRVAQGNLEANRAVYHSASVNGNNKSSNNKLNRLASHIIAMELFLNFVPQLVSFVATKMFSITISQYVGPYNVYLTAIEVFVLSSMYSRILYKSINKDSLTTVNPRLS